MYAVERMLHDPTDRQLSSTVSQYDIDGYPERICLDDGREFMLDRPDFTKCILDNYQLCHYHNAEFEKFSSALEGKLCHNGQSYNHEIARVLKMLNSLLPEKYTSCVRQLLLEGNRFFSLS